MLDLTDYTTSPQLPQLEVSTFSEENSLPGDANCDNKITVADAVAVLQYIANAEKYPLSDQGKTNADIDCEDGITGGDARAIQRLDAGLSVSVEETIHYYSTAEELISLLVSKDENFSDHGLIYAPGYKFDAVLNGAGGDSNKVDYLIVYGIDPDDCMRYGNIQKMPDDIVLNNSEFARNGIPEFHCGKIESIGCCGDYKIRSKSGNFLWIVYFIDGITPGFMAKTTDEDWTEACGFSYMPYVFPDGADNN